MDIKSSVRILELSLLEENSFEPRRNPLIEGRYGLTDKEEKNSPPNAGSRPRNGFSKQPYRRFPG